MDGGIELVDFGDYCSVFMSGIASVDLQAVLRLKDESNWKINEYTPASELVNESESTNIRCFLGASVDKLDVVWCHIRNLHSAFVPSSESLEVVLVNAVGTAALFDAAILIRLRRFWSERNLWSW